MIAINEEKLAEVGDLALDKWLRYYKGGAVNAEEADRAIKSMRMILQYNATKRVGDALQWSIVRTLSENPAQMADYVSNSLPHLMPAKHLETK